MHHNAGEGGSRIPPLPHSLEPGTNNLCKNTHYRINVMMFTESRGVRHSSLFKQKTIRAVVCLQNGSEINEEAIPRSERLHFLIRLVPAYVTNS